MWFAILGGTAINLQLSGEANLTDAVAQPEVALFTLLEQFPLAAVTSVVVIVLVGGVLRQRRRRRLDRDGDAVVSRRTRAAAAVVAFWGTLMGAVAIMLLLAGGLETLQQAAIIVGAPFTLVLLGLAVSLYRALRAERPPVPEPSRRSPSPTPDPPGPSRAVPAAADLSERKEASWIATPAAVPWAVRHGRGAQPHAGVLAGRGRAAGERRTHATAWIPTMDIFARDDDLVIRCELAGMVATRCRSRLSTVP